MTERSVSRTTGPTRAGLIVLAAGTVAIGVAYAVAMITGAAPGWIAWLLAFGAAATPVGLFLIGAVTRGAHSRAMTVLLGVLFGVLFTSFGAALALSPTEAGGAPLLLGLPLRLAIVFYGVGFLPLFALPLAYAMTFRGGADSRS